MAEATSYSHCPECGQRVIAGQFLCGHSPKAVSPPETARQRIEFCMSMVEMRFLEEQERGHLMLDLAYAIDNLRKSLDITTPWNWRKE